MCGRPVVAQGHVIARGHRRALTPGPADTPRTTSRDRPRSRARSNMLRTLIGLVACTRSSFEPVRSETSPDDDPGTSPGLPPAAHCDAAEHLVLNEVSP